jgi:hypothetical protein
MPATTRVPAMIAALVAAFGADPAIGAGDPPPVRVADGPKVSAETGGLTLWVGVEDIGDAAPAAAASEQQWMPGGGRRGRTEQLTVPCTIQAKSGSDDIAPLREQAADVLAAAEAVLRADPSLGGLLPNQDAAVISAEWRQYPASPGMAVRVMFTISATAILGP